MRFLTIIMAICMFLISFQYIFALSKQEAEEWYKNAVLEKTSGKKIKLEDLEKIRNEMHQRMKQHHSEL
ncbi:unnamed protein product [Brachionus calyciflorus]|uniref:Uncharacterized protein n=1 Tax=Brachionus calyciflorus TaxID=104777 RepID=A0A814BED8_9BILA|nr:unnamed protein product [Brachionus calyciflorus]